jgi:hypothetical protein
MGRLWLLAVQAACGLFLAAPEPDRAFLQWQDLRVRLVGPAEGPDAPECLVGPAMSQSIESRWTWTFEDALLVLAMAAIAGGVTATFLDQWYDHTDMGCWYRLMERTVGYDKWTVFVLLCSVISAAVLDWIDLVTDIMVVVSYANCGEWLWFAIGITILVASTVFIAHNATLIESNVSRPARFVMAFFQLDLLVEGVASVRNGRKSIHFARSKFLEGLFESCPQAFLTIYVLYAMHAESHFWLVVSTLVSIMSLAYGLSEWLEIGVDERIFLHTFWYHHLCRTCYFTVDFTLRLVTVALFLHEPALQALAAVILPAVVLAYILVASAYTHDVSQMAKTLLLTFFINLLPAELRQREGRERFLYLLDPELRAQLHNPILLVRICEFTSLCFIIVYVASFNHPRRSVTLGALLIADVILVWCVRLMTARLAEQHNELRRQSSIFEKEGVPVALESALDA